jgi:hypothetical protein
MRKVVSIENQWLGDLAVREAGDISAVVKMAIENDIPITGKIEAGTVLKNPGAVNERIVDYYRSRNIYPATAMECTPGTPGGIGYMAVGITFTVS